MSSTNILITGGAGYIGSHVVKELGLQKESIVVLDNLSTGFRESVLYGTFVEGDTGDHELVTQILRQHKIRSVMHFAAHTIVPESVENPLKYYGNNTCNTHNLLRCCQAEGVEHFIFSSTAAVYGNPQDSRCAEDTPLNPINPYGASKMMSEMMLRDLSAATAMRHVILRYFNVAGCDPQGEIGQRTRNATLLIKVAAEVAIGKRRKLSIYGTDYPTPDGTGVRDYIHVADLADAHIKALQYLRDDGQSTTLNCGYGHGYSVREVIASVNRMGGADIPVEELPRRAGDPAALIAGADKIREVLDWKPQNDNLDYIVGSSIAWELRMVGMNSEVRRLEREALQKQEQDDSGHKYEFVGGMTGTSPTNSIPSRKP